MKHITKNLPDAIISKNKKEARKKLQSNFQVEDNLSNKLRPLIFPRRLYPQLLDIKRSIGCLSYEKVIIDGEKLIVRGYEYSYHSLFHYEIAHLSRIKFGTDLVSGIHGFSSPMFHDEPIEIEYDGVFDEARVAIHEWLTRTSIFTTIKALNWMLWLFLVGINPIKVILAHCTSIKSYQGKLPIDFKKQDRVNVYRILDKFQIFDSKLN